MLPISTKEKRKGNQFKLSYRFKLDIGKNFLTVKAANCWKKITKEACHILFSEGPKFFLIFFFWGEKRQINSKSFWRDYSITEGAQVLITEAQVQLPPLNLPAG